MLWTLYQFHRSQLMGEMVLLLLICLLLIQFRLQALQFALRHLLPPIIHFLLLLHLHLHLHHPLLLFLLTPNALDIPDMWLPEQWSIPDHYKQPREPTPAVESSDNDSSGSDDPLDLIQAGVASTPEPTSFRQSQQCSDANLWQKACEEEMEAHRLNA